MAVQGSEAVPPGDPLEGRRDPDACLLRALFYDAADGMAVLGADGRLRRLNAAFGRLAAAGVPAHRPPKIWELPVFAAAAVRRAVRSGFRAALEGEAARCVVPIETGEARAPADLSFSPLTGPEGEIVFVLVRIAEAGERVRRQRQLATSQRFEAIGRVAGRFAHDCNNALGAVIGNLDLIVSNPKGADPSILELANEAMTAAEGGAERVNTLLRLARPAVAAGGVVDAGEIIGRPAELARRTDDGGCAIVAEPPRQALPISADPAELEAALLGVLLRWRGAVPAGGAITLAAGDAREIPDGRPGRFVRIAIATSGCQTPVDDAPDVLGAIHGLVAPSGGFAALTTIGHRDVELALYFPCAGVAERTSSRT